MTAPPSGPPRRLPEEDNLDLELTAGNLTTYARYFGLRRKVAVAAPTSCWSSCSWPSGPTQGRSALRRHEATADHRPGLVNEPDIVLLDEPTTGLDPQARHLVWERLFRLKQRGVTLVLTTHYMDEAEQLCDRLVVMDGGRIVAEGSPRALIQYSTRRSWSCASPTSRRTWPGSWTESVSGVEVLPDRLLLYADDGDAAAAASRRGLHPTSVLVRRTTLEDVFLRLTGRSLVD